MPETWILYGVAFLFAALLAIKINQIEKYVRAIKNQVARQSLTFAKIETDIDTLHKALIEIGRNDERLQGTLIRLREQREHHFRSVIEDGFASSEILRGLDEPDMDDDPNYWEHRQKMFGSRDDE